jgi:hypothetical protein
MARGKILNLNGDDTEAVRREYTAIALGAMLANPVFIGSLMESIRSHAEANSQQVNMQDEIVRRVGIMAVVQADYVIMAEKNVKPPGQR